MQNDDVPSLIEELEENAEANKDDNPLDIDAQILENFNRNNDFLNTQDAEAERNRLMGVKAPQVFFYIIFLILIVLYSVF